MFYAIPLDQRPSWRNPPWATVLLILVNLLVFWGPQRWEAKAIDRAAQGYLSSPLPDIELPRFVQWLEDSGRRDAGRAQRLLASGRQHALLQWMEREEAFQARLHADQVVRKDEPVHADWKAARARYDATLPEPFTRRWAHSYKEDAPTRPVTWITAAFLHASTGHLLGNMVFLFLFGFSVELALGRGLYLAFYLLGALGGSLMAGWAYAGQETYGLGASGAVSALMGMYAVLYRLRRVRFFYQLFFYFNYVTAPAILLLPAWIANELLQHWLSGKGVAYMAHLGGLLTGAALMAGAGLVRRQAIPVPQAQAPAVPDDGFDGHVAQARQLAKAMQFERALVQWRAAAQLRPHDLPVLSAWFKTASLWPSGDDFHRAARRIFRLSPQDAATLDFQHASYRTYLDTAKPSARLVPDDMAALARRFVRGGHWSDAEKLLTALHRTAPQHTALGELVGMLVTALLQSGRRDQAMAWRPQLQQLAPGSAPLRQLEGLEGLASASAIER
ncbi:rhomboid family intramembrane serine protease [Acidovorax sp. SUPP3334]|uniref:rhomboid family protein n=1 Tax=Acidovorax sp. SUPP3334 TaxID=2920881 RepID=UPI0023DE566C|nr:rhomboid family intramembrane serine protease [Acidovorax sp. SUPP3334]GKT20579.1 rhomboid family intramembrane serine protease [Acidovorax sp. SUPP3334]